MNENVKEYAFYYDETYHDKKLTFKENSNIEKEKNDSEFFLGCFLGSNQWGNIKNEVLKLEKDYKQKEGINEGEELKSNNLIKPKYLVNGISSLPEKNVKFYSELFKILDKRVDIHLIFLNKYEEIIMKAIPNDKWFYSKGINYKEFVYSLTKFVSHHKDKYDFLSILYSNNKNKIKNDNFIKIFKAHKEQIENIDKKQDEVRLMNIFVDVFSIKTFYLKKIPKKIKWNYDKVSLSFKNYCFSENIDFGKIIIDNEENTLKSMKQYKIPFVYCVDSKGEIAVRICDWIVGFIGKIVFSYSRQIKDLKDIEFTERLSLLAKEDFVFREDQKKLITQIYKLFLVQQDNYWATTTSNYFDYTMLFYTFIRYCELGKEKLNPIDFNAELHKEFIATCLNLFYKGD